MLKNIKAVEHLLTVAENLVLMQGLREAIYFFSYLLLE